jgi:creatinine amidohydrolase
MSAPESEILLGKLTRREFRERMVSGELAGCLIPVAAIEQHLEHMAMEHDWRSVGLVTRAVAEQLAPRVLVAEGLMCGISEHHMKHPGTLTLSPGTFLAALSDLIDSTARAGFRNIVVVNGHGGNVEPVRGTWDQFLRRFEGVNLHFLSYWDTLGQADANDLLRGGRRLSDDMPGHAQEFETAIALAKFPENVRADALADQPDQSPALATAEQGAEWFKRVTERLAKYVGEVIDGQRQCETPPFHP